MSHVCGKLCYKKKMFAKLGCLPLPWPYSGEACGRASLAMAKRMEIQNFSNFWIWLFTTREKYIWFNLFPGKKVYNILRFLHLDLTFFVQILHRYLHENQKQCSLVLKYYRAPLSVQDISSTIDVSLVSLVMSDLSNVSISFTTAIVYLASGTFFFLLIFLLVMLGISDCHFLSR